MGCSFSTKTAVQPLEPGEANGGEDETGSKHDGRGDSAVSKGTTDSGVVMENREIPVLPGGLARKTPPLTVSEMDTFTQDGIRPKSSEILEELLHQGIIPAAGQRGSTAGEAFSIMLDEREAVSRRPPARLESLKANKTQSFSREEFDERIRLAEERRKLKEDELKTRLRTKSARVRGPAPASATSSSTNVDGHTALTPVEPILHPLAPDHHDPPLHSQITREEAEGAEHSGEASDIREGGEERGRVERRQGEQERENSRENIRERADRGSEADDGEEEEELTQVEEFKKDLLLAAPDELENDSSFQEDKEDIF